MIYLGFPYGSNFGWGVLGKEVALAMAQLSELRVLSPPNVDQRIADEFDVFQLRKLVASTENHGRQSGEFWEMDGPVITTAVGRTLDPFVWHIAPPLHVGYAVFEESILSKEVIARARQRYRRLAAGSTYCANVLREHGLSDVALILHGVDTTLFCPRAERRSFLTDHFLIFSGGKFELRKGQDIVIRAYKVMQDRHRDVILVNSWNNNWPKSRDSMSDSNLIRYIPPRDNNYSGWMNSLLGYHGIDLERVITVGPRDQRLLPSLYHATDLGLFPNRVEGGNNMVLMEYLACGKPAVVSYNSGHTDIVNRMNAVLIENHRPMDRREGAELTAVWNDPNVDETIEKLEWCYQHREQLQPLGQRAAADMRELTWKRLAEGLLSCLCEVDAKG